MTRPVSAVPDGWESKRLEEVCRLWNGRAYKKEELLERGKHLVLRVGNFFTNDRWYYSDLELADEKYCDDGDLLYAWSASFGPRLWAGGKAIYHYHIWKIVVDDRLINKDFLFYFLDWDAEQIKSSMGSGSTMIHVTKGAMEQRSISLPPLDEQRRIAEVLRSVDEAIAATDAALAAGRNTHRLTLEALFGVCFSETAAGDAAPVAVGQVCMRVTYGFTNPMPTTDEGPWMLTAANVRHGWIDYYSARHTSATAYANDISEKSRPPIGSVLVTKDGTLGRVARVDRPNVCINQSVAVLIPADDTVDGAFLSYLLQCPTGQDRMLADSGGSSVKHIYISKLAELPFMLPTMAVQRERAMLAEESERAVQAQTAALDGLLALKSHVMSDLLSGRVRVPA